MTAIIPNPAREATAVRMYDPFDGTIAIVCALRPDTINTDVPDLIGKVHAALVAISAPRQAAEPEPPAELVPAVPIRKSITPDYLVCLDDGLRFKSLKRHLHTLGMTPEQYREKWGLPADYPMAAPRYSAQRAEIAKAMGLGRKA